MSSDEISAILNRYVLKDGIERDILREYLMQRDIKGWSSEWHLCQTARK